MTNPAKDAVTAFAEALAERLDELQHRQERNVHADLILGIAIAVRRALERAKAEAATEAKPEYAVRYFKPHGLHEGLPCPRCTEVVRDPLRHWSQSEGWACLQSLATSPPPPKPAAGEERPCARCGQPEPAANHHGDLFDDHPYEPPAPSPTSELVCGRCGAPIEGIRCSRWRDGCQGGASEAKPKPTSAASDGVAWLREYAINEVADKEDADKLRTIAADYERVIVERDAWEGKYDAAWQRLSKVVGNTDSLENAIERVVEERDAALGERDALEIVLKGVSAARDAAIAALAKVAHLGQCARLGGACAVAKLAEREP